MVVFVSWQVHELATKQHLSPRQTTFWHLWMQMGSKHMRKGAHQVTDRTWLLRLLVHQHKERWFKLWTVWPHLLLRKHLLQWILHRHFHQPSPLRGLSQYLSWSCPLPIRFVWLLLARKFVDFFWRALTWSLDQYSQCMIHCRNAVVCCEQNKEFVSSSDLSGHNCFCKSVCSNRTYIKCFIQRSGE